MPALVALPQLWLQSQLVQPGAAWALPPALRVVGIWLVCMSELVEMPDVPTREQIERLQYEVAQMPQAELPTEHYFSEAGMYCRKVFRPAGTLIIGKVHKQHHLFLCAMGEIIAWTENGMRRLQAGDVVESKPGTKRVTLATTDAIGITIHKTDKTDLDEIEAELIEPDETALFDARNKLKSAIKSLQGEVK
jgi:quercetin dioxygenase-like cupin family protein